MIETKTNEIKIWEYDMMREEHESYKKIIKRLIKSIPRGELKNILIEMKILKQDYVTKKISIKEE